MKKILWLTNIPLPEVCERLNIQIPPFGGWLVTAAKELAARGSVELTIVFPMPCGAVESVKVTVGDTKYHGYVNNLPFAESEDRRRYFETLLNDSRPDLVHIFGTEYPHAADMAVAANKMKIPVGINVQGLISIIAKHYVSGLPGGLLNSFTFRDFVKQDTISQQRSRFEKRGRSEVKALKCADFIIGRTTWDKACTSQINSEATYYHCEETLREAFYEQSWELSACQRNSIFISQASYPVKGLHFLLEAMPIILSQFPDAMLYIAGPDIVNESTIKDRIKQSTYARYIARQIKQYDLCRVVKFLGLMDEHEMCRQFVKAHIFVSPSTIENESNSVSEARMLGVPVVASYVGGVIDRISHGEDGYLYQHDAPYMLAHFVNTIFGSDEQALKFSALGKTRARALHGKKENARNLEYIYSSALYANVENLL